MLQVQLFQDSTAWLTALAADVEAAGGEKIVGSDLWPTLDPDTASRKMSNALNTKQKQQLSYGEIRRVKRLARMATGRSQLHAFESKELECDLHWRTMEDINELVMERFTSLSRQHEQLQQEMQRSAELFSKLKVMGK